MPNPRTIETRVVNTQLDLFMDTSSLLYYKRFAKRPTEARKQIIAFCLRQNWFALPIDAVHRVILIQEVDNDSPITYQGKELKIIDVGHQLFGEAEGKNNGLWVKENQGNEPNSLLILTIDSEIFLGIPLDSPPEVLRVPESAFTTLSKPDLEQRNISCVSSMILSQDRPSLFFLEPQQLALTSENKISE